MNSSVMFTALPSGIVSATASGTVVSLSVYVTPQLGAGASLSPGQPFADWPATVSALAFHVTLGTSASGSVAPCALDPGPNGSYATDRFDSGLWATIFRTASAPVTVNPFAVSNYTASGVLSYGSQAVSSAVKATYGSVASRITQADDHPRRDRRALDRDGRCGGGLSFPPPAGSSIP